MSIRKSRYAGSWYPGDGASLKAALNGYLDSVETGSNCLSGKGERDGSLLFPKALIVPHAGYVYSAPTAAWAFSAIKGASYKTVIVMAPSHRVAFDGVAVWPSGYFSTPLGQIPVDEELVSRLMEQSCVVQDYREPHMDEHSLEMELPFLQHLLKDFALVPLIIGGSSRQTITALSRALHMVVNDRDDILIVASTDLSHFHSASTAEKLDAKAIECMKAMDSEKLLDYEMSGTCELCGLMPVATLLSLACLAECTCTVSKYTHSGNMTGDTASVVGYISAVIR